MENQLTSWSNSKRVAFRFAFILIFGFILLKNNGAYPFFEYISKPIVSLFHTITPWFSKNILHYQYDFSIFTNGSGDTSYDWVSLIIIFLLAIISTPIWSLLDRNRKSYAHGYYWLTVAVRYYIAFMLINYGAIKLIHAQMPPPSLYRLMEPLHEFSPMGLAWTYLGYSKAYNIFMGIVEIMAALLLFRRTVVIGALVTMATAINIMTVNYFFDVPVKMLSTALFLFSLFLLIPYIKSIYKFFIAGDKTELPQINVPAFKSKSLNRTLIVFKYILLTAFVVLQVKGLFDSKKMIAQYFKKSPLHGIYKVEERNKPFKTIPNDWSYLVLEYDGKGMVRDRFYNKEQHDIPVNTFKKEIKLNNYILNYSVATNGDITVTKVLPDGTESTKLLKINPEEMELMKAKFKLIQEYPHNR